MRRDEWTTNDRRLEAVVLAKGALTTGTLALGTGTFGTATAGAQTERVAVFANNYYPGATFDVIDRIETGTTVDILRAGGKLFQRFPSPMSGSDTSSDTRSALQNRGSRHSYSRRDSV